MGVLSMFFTPKINNSREECRKETRRILGNATTYELQRMLKDLGYYNDYKNYSRQYIIDKFCEKAYDNCKIYRIF